MTADCLSWSMRTETSSLRDDALERRGDDMEISTVVYVELFMAHISLNRQFTGMPACALLFTAARHIRLKAPLYGALRIHI